MRVKKRKPFWAMTAAWDRSEEFCDPAGKEDISDRTRTRLDLWEEHLKDPLAALATALECLDNSFWEFGFWFHSLLLPTVVVAMTCSIVGAKILQKMWEGHYWEGVCSGPMGCSGIAHTV